MIEVFRSLAAYQHVLEQVRAKTPMPPLGLARATRLPILAALLADLQAPVLFITDRSDHALTILDEVGFWTQQTSQRHFPEPNPMFYEQAAWGTSTRRDRLQALSLLALYHLPSAPRPQSPPLIVATLRAVMARTMPRRDFIRNLRTLKRGQQVKPEALRRAWVEVGYQPAEIVVEAGQFAQRGGILDIWPVAERDPLRFEFFGDEIDTMRRFDPATQRTIQPVDQVLISPARELLIGKAAGARHGAAGAQRVAPAPGPPRPRQHPGLFAPPGPGASWMTNRCSAPPPLRLRSNPSACARNRSRRAPSRPIFPSPTTPGRSCRIPWPATTRLIWATPTEEERSDLALCFEPGPRFGGRLKPLMDDMLARCQCSEQAVIVSRQVSRLRELWQERVSACDTPAAPRFVEGTLSEGWVLHLPEAGSRLHLLTDSEIFGWERPQPRQRRAPGGRSRLKPIYADLQAGRLGGACRLRHRPLRRAGAPRRWMAQSASSCWSSTSSGDQLFVPVHQADRLSRYIGPSGEAPPLTRLGTQRMGQGQAARARSGAGSGPGTARAVRPAPGGPRATPSSADTPWQQELEASFPYVETDDQLQRHPGGQAGYGSGAPDGPPAVRRRGLRQDRGGPAGGLQGGHGRQAGGRAGADHRAGPAALRDLPPAPGGLPGDGGDALPLPHARASRTRSSSKLAAGDGGYRHRHPPPDLSRTCSSRTWAW